MNSARLVSPFQILWLCASEMMSYDNLLAIKSDLKGREAVLLAAAERTNLDLAVAELDGLIISRLAKELTSAHDVEP